MENKIVITIIDIFQLYTHLWDVQGTQQLGGHKGENAAHFATNHDKKLKNAETHENSYGEYD